MPVTRLYKCQMCGVIYNGHELQPTRRFFPVRLEGPECPTPHCTGSTFIGQATPLESGLIMGLQALVILVPVFHWLAGQSWTNAAFSAIVIATFVTVLSTWWYRPSSRKEDDKFAAHEMAREAQAFQRKGRLEIAQWRYKRAAELLGEGVDQELEASILGYWANLEKDLGNAACAMDLYQRALHLAEEMRDISGIVNRLNNIAALLGDNLSNPADALPYLDRALPLARKLGDNSRMVLILVHTATRARELDRSEQATQCLDEANELAQNLSQPFPLADVLHEKASLAAAQSRNSDAILFLNQLLSLRGLDDTSPIVEHAKQMIQAATAAMKTGGKIHILPPGLNVPEEKEIQGLPNLPQEIEVVLDPAMEHMLCERLALAAKAFSEALNTVCVQRSPVACALVAMNLGDIWRELGRTDKAIEICQKGLEWEKQANLPIIRRGLLLNLGLALRTKGRWGESRAAYEQALNLSDSTISPQGCGRILLALGDLLRDSNEFEQAEHYYKSAAECAVSEDDLELPGAVLIGIGNLHFRTARRNAQEHEGNNVSASVVQSLEEAEKQYNAAASFARNHRRPKLEALALRMLGNVYRRMDKADEAIKVLKAALSLMPSEEADDKRAGRLNDLAVAEQQLGRIDDALAHYAQSVKIIQQHGRISPDIAGCIENYGVLLVRQRRGAEGTQLMIQASRMDNRMVPQAFAIASESNRVGFLRCAESRLDDLISLVASGGPAANDPDAVESCADAVFARKGATQEALIAQKEFSEKEGCVTEDTTQVELAAVRMELARLTLAGNGMRADGSYSSEASRLDEQRRGLEQRLAQHFPIALMDRRIQRASCKTLMMHLDNMSALIEYIRFRHFEFPEGDQVAMWGPERYAAFVLCDKRPVRIIDLGEAKAIDELITQFRGTITGDEEKSRDIGSKSPAFACVNDVRQAGEALRKAVFDPLLVVSQNKKRLIVATDSELARLPLEALPLHENDWLIDHYDISYLSTGRDLLQPNRTNTGRSTDPIVVADPDFDLCKNSVTQANESPRDGRLRSLLPEHSHFERLPGSLDEGEAISRMLKIKMLSGCCALEGRIKAFRSPVLLHLSTHAFFLESIAKFPKERDVPLEEVDFLRGGNGQSQNGDHQIDPMLGSGICLAGINTWLKGGELPEEAEDGLLTAVDVSCLDLQNTEIVVLSACETGLGRTCRGEGVFGLRRAFVTAGTKTLVMSLWKVPDEQTSRLMQQFYTHLLEGKGRAEALRAAKLAIKKDYPNPFFWGAFICQGETRPLSLG